jgi:hypothetical protein
MVTVSWIINAHKILVTPIILAMMWYFHNKDRTGIFLPSLGIGSTRPRSAQQVSATRI